MGGSLYLNMDSVNNKIQDLVDTVNGDVSLRRLFPKEFLEEHHCHMDIEELLSGAGIKNQKSFDSSTDEEKSKCVSRNTDFISWSSMLNAAAKRFFLIKKDALASGTWVPESFDSDVEFDNIKIFLNFIF